MNKMIEPCIPPEILRYRTAVFLEGLVRQPSRLERAFGATVSNAFSSERWGLCRTGLVIDETRTIGDYCLRSISGLSVWAPREQLTDSARSILHFAARTQYKIDDAIAEVRTTAVRIGVAHDDNTGISSLQLEERDAFMTIREDIDAVQMPTGFASLKARSVNRVSTLHSEEELVRAFGLADAALEWFGSDNYAAEQVPRHHWLAA